MCHTFLGTQNVVSSENVVVSLNAKGAYNLVNKD